MAGPNGGPAAGNVSSLPPLTADELLEVQEYKKLLQFRDEVVAGLHPRIKATHLLGKPATSLAPVPSQTGAAKMPAERWSSNDGQFPVFSGELTEAAGKHVDDEPTWLGDFDGPLRAAHPSICA